MKQVFTLLFVVLTASSFAQIDGNNGVTRDNHTDGIESIDYQANIDAYAVNNRLVVKTSLPMPIENVTIFNLEGRVVTSQVATSTREEVNISGFVPGIYFVQVEIDDETVVKKVFISGQ